MTIVAFFAAIGLGGIFSLAALAAPRKMTPLPEGVTVTLEGRWEWETNKHYPLTPFERPRIKLKLSRDISEKVSWQDTNDFYLSDKSKINGKTVDKDLPDRLDRWMWECDGEKAIVWRLKYGENMIENRAGKQTVELIFDTPLGRWKAPPNEINIEWPEARQEELKAFEALKCDQFFCHPRGLRPARKTGFVWCWGDSRQQKQFDRAVSKPVPYDSLVKFISQYPDSPLVDLFKERLGDIWRDSLEAPKDYFRKGDKRDMARLLMIMEEDPLSFCENRKSVYENKVRDERGDDERKWQKEKLDNYKQWKSIFEQLAKDATVTEIRDRFQKEQKAKRAALRKDREQETQKSCRREAKTENAEGDAEKPKKEKSFNEDMADILGQLQKPAEKTEAAKEEKSGDDDDNDDAKSEGPAKPAKDKTSSGKKEELIFD